MTSMSSPPSFLAFLASSSEDEAELSCVKPDDLSQSPRPLSNPSLLPPPCARLLLL